MPKLFTKTQIRELSEYMPDFPQTINRWGQKRINTLLEDQGFDNMFEFKNFWLDELNNLKKEVKRLTTTEVVQVVDPLYMRDRKGVAEVKGVAKFVEMYKNLMQAHTNFRDWKFIILNYDPFDLQQQERKRMYYTYSLNRDSFKKLRRDVGTQLYQIVERNKNIIEGELDLSANGDIDEHYHLNCKFVFVPPIAPERYIHALKEGEIVNCFMKQLRAWFMLRKNNKMVNKVDDLNKRFFESGVTFDDIPTICKIIQCNVEIYNKLNDKVYEHQYSSGKSKTFKYVITKLDHVEQYVDNMFDMSKKEIVYVDNVQDAYDACDNNWKCYSKNDDGQLVSFFTEDKIYKDARTQDFDDGKHWINSEFDAEKLKFESKYELDRNTIIMNRDEKLFEFISKANHYVYELYLTENIDNKLMKKSEPVWDDLEGCYITDDFDETLVDLTQCHAYDQNKNYMSYKLNNYYSHYMFPRTGNFEFYDVNDASLTLDILDKTGFVQITNIQYDMCSHNVRSILERIAYFVENGIYATPIIKYLWDMGGRFTIKRVAFTNWKYDIDFGEEIINNKYYNRIVGMMDIKGSDRIYKTTFKNVEELKDILYTSSDKVCFYHDNELWFKFPKTCVKNNCHVSAFILSYAFMGVLDQLLKIPFEDIIGVKVDCIITKRNYDNVFSLSKKIGDWKKELKGERAIYNTTLINQHAPFVLESGLKLTKQKLQYGVLNFITGEAGSGKTTRYVKTFGDCDERVYNSLMCFPNNNLKHEFRKKHECQTSTYHKAFKVNSDGENNEGIKIQYYTNAIIDEASMIPLHDFEQIIKVANKYCVNLHVVGDFDIEKRRLYQLTPASSNNNIAGSKPLTDWFASEKAIPYTHLHLTQNYRQGKDKEFTCFLRQCRGKTNAEIMNELRKCDNIKRIKIDDISNVYEDGDVVLCSTHAYIDKVHAILGKRDKLQVIYNRTTRLHAKNEMALVDSSEFNEKDMKLAFGITTHICQGLEYTNKIFIVMNNHFDENMTYVCLSRAHCAEQVYLVYVPNGSAVMSFEDNVSRKLRQYKRDDLENNRDFNLDKEYVINMCERQGFKCKHCGTQVEKENYMPYSNRQFSIDRIDDSKGHLKGNVVLSCLGCNCRHVKT